MSKSKGNFFTARDLFAKGVTPAALRLELVRTHYRTNSNFTMQGLRDCQRMIDRWAAARVALVERAASASPNAASASPNAAQDGPLQRALVEFKDAVGDDLNLARAMAALNSAIGETAAGDAKAELTALGVRIKDGPQGTTWERAV